MEKWKLVLLAALFTVAGFLIGSRAHLYQEPSSKTVPKFDDAYLASEREAERLQQARNAIGKAIREKIATQAKPEARKQPRKRSRGSMLPTNPVWLKPLATKPSSSGVAVKKRRRSSRRTGLHIVSIDYRVVESNEVWWRFAWKAKIRNGSSGRIVVDVSVQFQDSDGFVLDDARAYRVPIGPGATYTVSEFALIDAGVAPRVRRISVKVKER